VFYLLTSLLKQRNFPYTKTLGTSKNENKQLNKITMKRTLIALTFVLITYSSFGQWSNTSNNGTQGAVKIKNYLLFDADGDFTGGNYFTIQDDPTNNYLRIGYRFNNHLNINSQGNIGIGTTSPTYNLHVKGTSYSGLTMESALGNDNFIEFKESTKQTFKVGIDSDKNLFKIARTNFNDNSFVVDYNGSVGIGTTNLSSWKLAVNGNIRAKEIKVETGWSDFVFDKKYNLPSLKEVENHIKEKGHLKDIPSAKEVEQNGIFLGEMDSKLLQKIEELTLYTIEQEKKINELESLNSKLLELQKRLEKLENQ